MKIKVKNDRGVLAALLALSLAVLSLAGAARAADVRAALVVDPALRDKGVGDPLAARLADHDRLPDVAWLEREQIARVLDEQALAAAVGDATAAADVGGRVRLGHLLKADLVLILRGSGGGAELVACQTATGLRLGRWQVDDADPAATVEALASAVGEAVARHGAKLEHVVVVPPFESGDLSRRRDALRAGLADLAEAALSRRPGALVIELAEARALAAELDLGGGERVERPTPTYLIGRYAHDPAGRMRLDLELRRGGEVIASNSAQDLSLPDAAGRVRSFAGRIGDADAVLAEAPSPAREAAELLELAALCSAAGDERGALNFAEASLLLVDDAAARRWAFAYAMSAGDRRRALDHAESWIGRTRLGPGAFYRGLFQLAEPLPPQLGPDPLGPEPGQTVRDAVLRVLRAKVAAGVYDGLVPSLRNAVGDTRSSDALGRDAARTWRWCVDAATLVAQLPGAEEEDLLRIFTGIYTGIPDSPRARAAAAALAKAEPPLAKRAAATMRSWLDSPWPERRGREPTPPPEPATRPTTYRAVPPERKVSFEPIQLADVRGRIVGWFAAADEGRTLDVLWAERGGFCDLYLLREPGRPERVASIVGDGWNRSAVCYDGRWVWSAPAGREGPARLLAIDPATGERREVGEAQGLPPDAIGAIALTPLGEGRVCAAVRFDGGGRRSYVAVINLAEGEERGPAVKILLQGLREDVPSDRPEAIFSPTYAATLDGPGEGERRVLIGRGMAMPQPLLIDPSGASPPRLITADWGVRNVVVIDGAGYGAGTPKAWSKGVLRFAAADADDADADATRVNDTPWTDGFLVRDDERLWQIENLGFLWVGDAPGEPWRRLATTVPAGASGRGMTLFRSGHYGLVATCEVAGRVLRVRVPAAPFVSFELPGKDEEE